MIFREVEDRDLIAQGATGSRGRLQRTRVSLGEACLQLSLAVGRNREDALDLSQDVFLKAYQNLKKLDDPAKFPGWLFRIAHNEAYSLLRKSAPGRRTRL